jgi:hypothetical protein
MAGLRREEGTGDMTAAMNAMNAMGHVSVCDTDSRLHAINWFAALYRSVKLRFYRLWPVSSFVESFTLFPYLRF